MKCYVSLLLLLLHCEGGNNVERGQKWTRIVFLFVLFGKHTYGKDKSSEKLFIPCTNCVLVVTIRYLKRERERGRE